MTVNEKNRYAPIKLPFVPFELVLCKKNAAFRARGNRLFQSFKLVYEHRCRP